MILFHTFRLWCSTTGTLVVRFGMMSVCWMFSKNALINLWLAPTVFLSGSGWLSIISFSSIMYSSRRSFVLWALCSRQLNPPKKSWRMNWRQLKHSKHIKLKKPAICSTSGEAISSPNSPTANYDPHHPNINHFLIFIISMKLSMHMQIF